ncbi:hypothetical protein JR316_0003760 [Psilocybe cubensis]|uniref:Uncharacterized protein n=2 Tax=Psilocybe cubensis TaxID=181762 RepID=A0A8H7Y2N1_PSICU|nr:hypothetical protein JR316_0003760 [Psilocybe cubensis]KAH9484279.1 hypothetical protein JR316_0003760 [Psilocybe cubensis]
MSASLRIRIPPQKPSTSTVADDMEVSEQAKRKRRPSKKYQDAEETRVKPGRTAGDEKSRRPSNAGRAPSPGVKDEEADVDVLADANEEGEDEVADYRSDHSAYRTTPASTSQKSKSKNAVDKQPRRKKARRMVVSESEDEDFKAAVEEEEEEVPVEPDAEDDDDDYLSFDDKPSKTTKGKAKGNQGKAANSNKGIKRKAKPHPDDIAVESKGSSIPASTSKKRLRTSQKFDDIDVDVVGGVVSPEASAAVDHASPSTTKHDSPLPTVPPKKPKLPTIKKTKLNPPGPNTPASTSAPAKNFSLDHTGAKGPTIEERKKLSLRQTDIDLSNSAVYKELFLKPGSVDGTPRRAKEEERRKELNKMRDEFKAKRAIESTHSFDLQAQFDKISQFEEKLRAERSSALYPNFLAAKWREKFEKERKRQRDWAYAISTNGLKEEGEVS